MAACLMSFAARTLIDSDLETMTAIDPVPHFAATYADARAKFLRAAAARGLPVAGRRHPTAVGAEGEDLYVDVAVVGEAGAPAMLLLTSATHGVEGFCGSGCQVGLLNDGEFVAAVQAARVRVVLLHALNPYGFSHLRRTNEDNVDLNRNFRDFASPPAPCAPYAEIHDLLVPAMWPPTPDNEARIGAYAARHGEKALQAAISGGQCEFPDGLFYGGVRAAWSNDLLRAVLREHGARSRQIGWIDFHTGLGPRGHGEKIFAGRNIAADLARAKAIWGDGVTTFHDGSSTSAPLTGVNYNAVYEECPHAAYAGIALEYGTLPLAETFGALRADQWLANHPDVCPEVGARIKRTVRDAFYADTDEWKVQVYRQAREAALAAVRHLAAVN
jgi:hypothetical protein